MAGGGSNNGVQFYSLDTSAPVRPLRDTAAPATAANGAAAATAAGQPSNAAAVPANSSAANTGSTGSAATEPAGATRATGATADAAPAQSFTAVRELGSLQVGAGVVSVIQLPGDTFQHTAQQAGDFKLSATMADGSPLPGWVSFDSATGTFTLRPPEGTVATLAITVTARDREGKVATTDMALQVAGTSR